jgi:BNR/Asp-box repeat
MANIRVTVDSNPNNARSESSIAINPNNPLQVVSASKKFFNLKTYSFTLATEYSIDGGQSWSDSAALTLPGASTVMTDPTLAWDDSGNVYLVGLGGTIGTTPPVVNLTTGIIAMYKSTDGGKTWSAPYPIPGTGGADKQWVAGDSNPASPYHGNVYAVWDNLGTVPPGSTKGLAFARTLDHGASWIGAGGSPAGSLISTDGSDLPEITVTADGFVYIVSISGDEIELLVSTDGGNTFQPSGAPPAIGITVLQSPPLDETDSQFPAFPGSTFRLITDPTVCAIGPLVIIAWPDLRESFPGTATARIYYARSIDAGATWTTGSSGQPLLTQSISPSLQHFHPQITVDPNGVIACTYYEYGPKPSKDLIDVIISQSFDHGLSFDYFIVTDQPWDPAVDAPLAEAFPHTTFIGDYFGLDANVQGFLPLWTDTRTGIQELWTAIVPEKGCEVVILRSTLGQNEIDALRKSEGGDALVKQAFRVVVDGFDAATIGVHSTGDTLPISPLGPGINIVPRGNVSTSGSYGPGPQRFTFFYDLDFGTDPSDPAFGFGGATDTLTVSVSVAGVSAAGQIELIKQPDPFILHGDPPWLSIDLRVFVARANDTKAGVSFTGTPTDFIQHLAKALSNDPNGSQTFDDPNVFSPDEEASALYLSEKDENKIPVFNFGLARVRYNGLIGATDVRVFFRLFAAQMTTGIFDYPPGEQYRRTNNPEGDPIPLAGVIAGEYVTIPFFALPRVDTTHASMTTQQDTQTVGGVVYGNVQTINGNASGTEVDTFFGCWLDINTMTPVLPLRADPANLDGKFTDPGNPPLPIAQAMSRNLHQCLVAEINFGTLPIPPPGVDPSNSDKLAQRNISWAPVGSAEAATTFEVRPTRVDLAPGERADELMIDWGSTPVGSVASIYLPGTQAEAVISLASRMYTRHGLSRVDAHTVSCRAAGVTYVPIPPGAGSNYAGLLTIATPPAMRRGRTHTVVVRQLTNAFGQVLRDQGPPARAQTRGRGRAHAAAPQAVARQELRWRKVVGAFQLTMPVRAKASLLLREELGLSVLKWIGEAIPHHNRWYPVFHRYLHVIAGRVSSFGGHPITIKPSPIGLPGPGGGPGGGHGGGPGGGHGGGPGGGHGGGPGGGHGGGPGAHECEQFTGKIAGIRYDGFGDFEGFVLETPEGYRHRFHSIEARVLRIVERAWIERIMTTVTVSRHHSDRVLEIILEGAPPARHD